MAGTSWPTLAAGARARASDVEAKFNWLEGNIVPMLGGSQTDAAYDLGTSAARWRSGYFSTRVNTPSIGLSDTSFISFDATGTITANKPMKMTNGVAVNEFSSDGTLAGDSNLAVPTEKAIKAYVDERTGAGTLTTGNLSTALPRSIYSLTSASFANLQVSGPHEYLITLSGEIVGVTGSSGTCAVLIWADYGQTTTAEITLAGSIQRYIQEGFANTSTYRIHFCKTFETTGELSTSGSAKISLKVAHISGGGSGASISAFQLVAHRAF
jgi:hypothetical protein